MGRRWWQKEARSLQGARVLDVSLNESQNVAAIYEAEPVEAAVDQVEQEQFSHVADDKTDDYSEAAEDAASHLEQLIEEVNDEDLADEELNSDEDASDVSFDVVDTAPAAQVNVSRPNALPQNYGSNKKKKR